MVIALGLMIMCSNAVSAKTKATYKKGVVTIKGKGKFTSKKYQKNKKVKKVVVGKNVTKIGNYVFSECKNLKVVSFNKKLKSIGEYAFKYTALERVDLPLSVKKIGDGAFLCGSLRELKMPGKISWSYPEIENCWFFYTVDKVVFKSAVNYRTMLGVPAKYYVVYGKDKKYTSIKGGIYRKSDYKLMLIPRVKEFTICDKCRNLDLYNIYNYRYLYDDDYFATNNELQVLTIPASVNKITYSRPKSYNENVNFYETSSPLQIEVLNANLDEASSKNLAQWNNDFGENRLTE